MTEEEEELSPEEEERIEELLRGYGSPSQEEKHSIHSFLHKVSISNDTLKTGYLTEAELGIALFPVRTLKELELYSDKICDDPTMTEIFKKEAEILTASSLSKDGFLMKQSTSKSSYLNTNLQRKTMKENKGWFKKKSSNDSQEQQV